MRLLGRQAWGYTRTATILCRLPRKEFRALTTKNESRDEDGDGEGGVETFDVKCASSGSITVE